MMKKLTPVLVVDRIEPILPFWQAVGFTKTVEVPHEEHIGFVILHSGEVELMYQTTASVKADEPKIFDRSRFANASVYIEVEKLADVARMIPKGTDVVVEKRTTFYGANEMIVRDPAGNIVVFAETTAA